MTRLVNGLHNFGLFLSCAAFTTFFHLFTHEHRVESEMEMVQEEKHSTWTHIHLQREYLARCNNDQCKQEFTSIKCPSPLLIAKSNIEVTFLFAAGSCATRTNENADIFVLDK